MIRARCKNGGLLSVFLYDPVSKGHNKTIAFGRTWLYKDKDTVIFDSVPKGLNKHLSLFSCRHFLEDKTYNNYIEFSFVTTYAWYHWEGVNPEDAISTFFIKFFC